MRPAGRAPSGLGVAVTGSGGAHEIVLQCARGKP